MEPGSTVSDWNLVLQGSSGFQSRIHVSELSCELQMECFSKEY